MFDLHKLLTPLILRVDAERRVSPADERSAAILRANGEPDLLAELARDPEALLDAAGPWRVLKEPDGGFLLVGVAWESHAVIAQSLAPASLLDKQALLNVLPSSISEHLTDHRALQPKAYRESTVMFIDAVQFSRLAARVDPVSCLKQLDFYFSLFDQITSGFGVEKVTTIGDAYMGVAGIPQRRAAHAVDAALAAFRVALAVAARPGPIVDEWEWSFRIGLHSGPCISGLIGARRKVFDLWGDTVSIAAHVQRVGRPDAVSVSGATAQLIQEFFELQHDGTTVVRNAGEVEIHIVRGIRPELCAAEGPGLVNAAFHRRYEAAFGVACPEAAWRAQSAEAELFGAL
jgi:class 3 adenylate cyclase